MDIFRSCIHVGWTQLHFTLDAKFPIYLDQILSTKIFITMGQSYQKYPHRHVYLVHKSENNIHYFIGCTVQSQLQKGAQLPKKCSWSIQSGKKNSVHPQKYEDTLQIYKWMYVVQYWNRYEYVWSYDHKAKRHTKSKKETNLQNMKHFWLGWTKIHNSSYSWTVLNL